MPGPCKRMQFRGRGARGRQSLGLLLAILLAGCPRGGLRAAVDGGSGAPGALDWRDYLTPEPGRAPLRTGAMGLLRNGAALVVTPEGHGLVGRLFDAERRLQKTVALTLSPVSGGFDVAAVPDRGWVVAWTDGVYARALLVAPGGQFVGGSGGVQLGHADHGNVKAVRDTPDSVLVFWRTRRTVRAQRLSLSGEPLWAYPVNLGPAGSVRGEVIWNPTVQPDGGVELRIDGGWTTVDAAASIPYVVQVWPDGRVKRWDDPAGPSQGPGRRPGSQCPLPRAEFRPPAFDQESAAHPSFECAELAGSILQLQLGQGPACAPPFQLTSVLKGAVPVALPAFPASPGPAILQLYPDGQICSLLALNNDRKDVAGELRAYLTAWANPSPEVVARLLATGDHAEFVAGSALLDRISESQHADSGTRWGRR